MDDQCTTCISGFYLPSGRCDHCNNSRPAVPPAELAPQSAWQPITDKRAHDATMEVLRKVAERDGD